jgi:crotonobetainyl-CoA:carnitine CoA-transferase CaiB-like acyl-CoA transferase
VVRFLADVVVLDVGDEATALAGEYLAELGAEVVRVEDERGDVLRTRGPLWNAVHNSGKRSVAIDTTSDQGWEPVRGMLPGVHLVIGPLEPNPATQRFLDRVRAECARIGLVEVVFRRDDPPGTPATDLTVSAAGGLTVLNGHPDDPPTHAVGDLGWKQVALTAAEAALALLTARRRTGRAGHVVVSAQEAVATTTVQSSNANIWLWHGGVPSRHTLLAAGTTVLSADGRWTSFTVHPPNFPRFVEWAQRVLGPDTLAEPEWRDPLYVGAHRDQLTAFVAKLASVVDQADLVAEGQARGLLVLPVNELADIAADPHLNAREFFVDVPQPDGGTVRMAGSAFRSSLGRSERGPGPVLGADQELLGTLGEREPTRAGAREPRLPLAGTRIVDFCWAAAGPITTRLLADLGADVLKIESEHRLDPIRQVGTQPPGTSTLDTNGVFQDANAGKRAVTVNLDTEQGRDLARRLIATADVVTANYTPDRLDRWGFDHETLQRIRPGLVVANLAVMGLDGPHRGWRSYGSGVVAACGIAAHTGFEGRVPECLGTMHTDFTVPYFAAMQILAALHHRDRTGEGVYLELAQYETAVRLLDLEMAEVLQGGPGPGRVANRSPWCAPHGVYPSAGEDRWVAVACRDDAERARLRSVVGADDEESLAAWTRARSREDAVAELRAAAVPAAAVEDLADHQTRAPMRDLWHTFRLPSGHDTRTIHAPILWDGERLPLHRAPMWMEHTQDVVMNELGVDPERFVALLEERVLW